MVNTNQRHLHLTPIEEADALFAASQAGASKTRIRKATGLGKDHVGAALAAGRLSGETRLKTEACYGLNLEPNASRSSPATATEMHAGTLAFTATTPGSYQYLCPVPGHAREGMADTFTVR